MAEESESVGWCPNCEVGLMTPMTVWCVGCELNPNKAKEESKDE